MKSGELIGKEVVGSGGWKIGRINELIFDGHNWRISHIEINLDGDVAKEFEMKKLLSKTAINVDVASIHGVGDHVMLSLTKANLQEMAEQKKL
ncbi:MAG: PRC-barrel domain-containing protein [Thermoplasmata archaeon]